MSLKALVAKYGFGIKVYSSVTPSWPHFTVEKQVKPGVVLVRYDNGNEAEVLDEIVGCTNFELVFGQS